MRTNKIYKINKIYNKKRKRLALELKTKERKKKLESKREVRKGNRKGLKGIARVT